MPNEITIKGLEKLAAKLNKLAATAGYVGPTLETFGTNVRDIAGKYPPETVANLPRKGGWYQRGYGPKWHGGKGGAKRSENLGKQWYVQAEGLQVEIGNPASYAPYVHGLMQTSFHARNGWRVLETVVKQSGPELLRRLQASVKRIIDS